MLDGVKFTPVNPRTFKHNVILQDQEGKGSETITAASVGKTSKVQKNPKSGSGMKQGHKEMREVNP